MRRFDGFFVILMFALFPVGLLVLPEFAFAQTQLGEEPTGIGGMIWGVVLMISPVVLGSSFVTAFVSSKGGPVKTWIMRIVDFLAISWFKARNDPAAQ